MHKTIVYILAICWTLLVAVLCLVKFSKLPSFGVSSADKYVHFTFHFVFTMLWGYFSCLKRNKIVLTRIVILFFISIAYGILIEFLQQAFTVTRKSDVLDVLANLSGATTALVIFVLINTAKKKLKPANK